MSDFYPDMSLGIASEDVGAGPRSRAAPMLRSWGGNSAGGARCCWAGPATRGSVSFHVALVGCYTEGA